jgi:hypothetical protein
MTNSPDQPHTPHAPGSQPSVQPGSDEPQTITAPTPPVAWDGDSPDQADLTDDRAGGQAGEEDEREQDPRREVPGTTPQGG